MEIKTEDLKNYRPAHIEFVVNTSSCLLPEHIVLPEGEITADVVIEHMERMFVTENHALTVDRVMDHVEKTEIRKKINNILEDLLPVLEEDVLKKSVAAKEAKKELDNALTHVANYDLEAKVLAKTVKAGVVEMKLDQKFTWRIPYKGTFYYYTFIDKEMRLVKISEMSPKERQELFNQAKINEDYFDHGILKNNTVSVSNDDFVQNSIDAMQGIIDNSDSFNRIEITGTGIDSTIIVEKHEDFDTTEVGNVNNEHGGNHEAPIIEESSTTMNINTEEPTFENGGKSLKDTLKKNGKTATQIRKKE
jgi:hypothetical protein